MVAWSLMSMTSGSIFKNLKTFCCKFVAHISHVQYILFISSECPFILYLGRDAQTFQVYIIIIIL